MSSSTGHPYFPKDLVLENYKPNNIPLLKLLGIFFGFLLVTIIVTWKYSGTKPYTNNNPLLRLKICWFVGCAFIHIILEGFFAVFHETIPEDHSFLAQLCKS